MGDHETHGSKGLNRTARRKHSERSKPPDSEALTPGKDCESQQTAGEDAADKDIPSAAAQLAVDQPLTIAVPTASAEETTTAEEVERGRWLFAQDCAFVAGAASLSQIPADRLPEVAFAGRSNVGKSSLVNALTARRTLAKVSHTPGRTRQVNFFELGGALMLVDLPGYGYAAASKGDIKAWTRLIERYLTGRASLRRVLLLIDARHGPRDSDRDAMRMLDQAAVSYQCVLTKIDKITPTALTQEIERLATSFERHPAAYPYVLATSAETGAGIPLLRAMIARLADWSAEV